MTVLWIAPQLNDTTIGEKKAMPDPAYRGYTTRRDELVTAERNIGNVITETISGVVYGTDAGDLRKRHIAWKYTIEVKWMGLTPAQKNLIMNATKEEWCNVDFIDMDTDTKETNYMMYKGSGQTITGWGKYDPATRQFEHYDISMTLIQR